MNLRMHVQLPERWLQHMTILKEDTGFYTMSQDQGIVTIIKTSVMSLIYSEALTNHWKDEKDKRWERCW